MITFILVTLAGIFNAVMDKIAFNYSSSIFKNLNPRFWNLKESWKNQWKWPLEPFTGRYYFGLYKPRYRENFPYSSTVLVWMTDAWHLAKAIMLGLLMLAITNYTPVLGLLLDSLIYYCAFTICFTYFYSYILKSK